MLHKKHENISFKVALNLTWTESVEGGNISTNLSIILIINNVSKYKRFKENYFKKKSCSEFVAKYKCSKSTLRGEIPIG